MNDASDPSASVQKETPGDKTPQRPQSTWATLRQHTPARVDLGRVGASLPTREVLDFSMAHARARDAVHMALDTSTMAASLQAAGFSTCVIKSRAANRAEYLRRPDLGRSMHPDSIPAVLAQPRTSTTHRLTIVVADGLSSLAPTRHALPLLQALQSHLAIVSSNGSPEWSIDTVFLATQSRVALADEVAELREAEAVAILIGERPGLSAPDSLGIYTTYAPRKGRLDSERNCISNIRAGGLSYGEAAFKLYLLLSQFRHHGLSGVAIKDESDPDTPGLRRLNTST
jgi:ethanolamine ammonia-lyase small subunit